MIKMSHIEKPRPLPKYKIGDIVSTDMTRSKSETVLIVGYYFDMNLDEYQYNCVPIEDLKCRYVLQHQIKQVDDPIKMK